MSVEINLPEEQEQGSVPRDAPRVAWACPLCQETLVEQKQDLLTDAWCCPACQQAFPICQIGEASIPWLFPDPMGAATDWQARYAGFLVQNQATQDGLSAALHAAGLTVLNRERLERQLHARKVQAQQIATLLEPLGFAAEPGVAGVDLSRLGASVSKQQGLLSYHDNLFRDWCWDNGENEAQLKVLEGLWGSRPVALGRLLTLGAGAGRLAFDLQRRYGAVSATLLDCNPLLLILAYHLFQGRSLELFEFPIAPLNSRSHAVLQRCQRPAVDQPQGLEETRFVFADACKAPFTDASFDTVLTPWLLDILPCDLGEFAPQVNRLLPIGGQWLNTGPLAFGHSNQRWCYSEEETLELVEQQGFEVVQVQRERIPYLQSPHSAHGRVETLFSFRAVKIAEYPHQCTAGYLPQWAGSLDESVPASQELSEAATRHLLVAQVLAAVDGKRSVEQIGGLVAKKYGLSNPEALAAVRKILLDAAG